MALPGRKFSSVGEYRYGFNGQEKDDEVSGAGNINTAMFWEYDTRLGRRWNIDPKPQFDFSDYSCFGDNPIANTDINGDKFKNTKGKDDDSEYNSMKNKMESRKKELESTISQIEGNIKELKDGTSITQPVTTIKDEEFALNYQKKMLSEVNKGLNELEDMKNSAQSFILNPTKMDGGLTIYNKRFKAVQMNFNQASWSTGAHELKHGFNFLQGKESFDKSGENGGWLTDKTDEVATYQRQFAMDPTYVITNLAKDKIYVFQASDINTQNIGNLGKDYVPKPKNERNNSGLNRMLARLFNNITVNSKDQVK